SGVDIRELGHEGMGHLHGPGQVADQGVEERFPGAVSGALEEGAQDGHLLAVRVSALLVCCQVSPGQFRFALHRTPPGTGAYSILARAALTARARAEATFRVTPRRPVASKGHADADFSRWARKRGVGDEV